MFCTLYFIFITFGSESETAIIKVDTTEARQKIERLVHGYINTINKWTMQFPNHEIQLQFEFNGPVTTKPTPLPFRRSNVRVIKHPKKILRSDNITNASMATPSNTSIYSKFGACRMTQGKLTTMSEVRQLEDSNKAPIYLDDLKKALDEFGKKLSSNSNCNGIYNNTAKSSAGQMHSTSHPTVKPNRSIQDILQLIGKGVTVDYNVPKPTDESLDWLQIKIPNNV